MRVLIFFFGGFLVLSVCVPANVSADEEERVRLYRTPEEQREVGLSRQITSWLKASGLFELEWSRDEFSVLSPEAEVVELEKSAALQVGLIATPTEASEVELVLEFDTQTDRVQTDELTATIEIGDWGLTVGRQSTPFGEYFSGFATSPLVEFGETVDGSVNLSYEFRDGFDASLSLYEGVAGKLGKEGRGLDWVVALESITSENLSFGLSYQSDLADSEARLLADRDNRFSRKVPGLSGYFLWNASNFEIILETVAAARSFIELEADRDQPLAWNVELATFPYSFVDLAFRVEGSRELEDAPHIQLGVAATFLIKRNVTFSGEVLHGRFKGDLATDEDSSFDNVTRVSALLSIAF